MNATFRKSILQLAAVILALSVQTPGIAQRVYPSTAFLDTLRLELPSIPDTAVIVVHEGYTAAFNEEFLEPDWVAYELTREELQGGNERNGSFKKDPLLPLRQAVTSDYTGTGYDRGHMAPAADMKWSASVMKESFYLSNICPQHPSLNRHYWLDLEDMTRNAAQEFGVVWVISGPVFNEDPPVIGKNKVAVPQGFFKALLSEKDGVYFSVGFLLINDDSKQTASEVMMSVDDLEDLTGMNLFKALGPLNEYAEKGVSPSLWGLSQTNADF